MYEVTLRQRESVARGGRPSEYQEMCDEYVDIDIVGSNVT